MTRAKGTSPDEPATPHSAPPDPPEGTAAAGSAGAGGTPGPVSVPALADQAAVELGRLDGELAEIELLITQARTEASRHETRRAQGAEKLAAAKGDPKEAADLATQLVALTKRATVMEAQVEVLEGKQRSLARYRDALAGYAAALRTLAEGVGETWMPVEAPAPRDEAAGITPEAEAAALPPAISRVVLGAQEDLRREIARAMHDGPAQSLTNIVLQAQIVDRLLDRDPALAKAELRQLIGVVQQTIEATKTFIFDVRPMVLDDLGLVPTLRRATRDRGARARIKAEFESVGVDRRLSPEVESALFRMLDDALAAHVKGSPERLTMHLDWGESLVIELVAGRAVTTIDALDLPSDGEELPPALAAMVEERRAAHEAAAEAARMASLARLPNRVWREIAERCALLGIQAELLDEGTRLRLSVPLPQAS